MEAQNFINMVTKTFCNLYEDSSDEDGDCSKELGLKITNFAEEIVPTYPNQQFKEHFRLNIETFNLLCKGVGSRHG